MPNARHCWRRWRPPQHLPLRRQQMRLEPPGAVDERGEEDGEAAVVVAQLRRIRSPG